MKRKLIIAAFAVLGIVGYTNAQTTLFGVKAGYNAAKMTDDNGDVSSEVLSKYHAGLVADLGITDMFSVRTGLDLQSKGYKASGSATGGSYEYTLNPLYLELPVNFTVNFPVANNVKFYAGAGPYVAVGIGGKIKGSGTSPIFGSVTSERNIEFGNDNNDDLKQVDAGLNVVGGLTFSNKFGINLQYGIGLVNTIAGEDNSSDYKSQHRVFGVGGVFYF